MDATQDLTDEQQAKLMKFLQPQEAGQIGPSVVPAESVPQETSSDDTADAKDTHLTPEVNDSTDGKIVDSHPGVQPEELTPYLKNQEVQSDRWGPDKEAAVMDRITKGYKSPGFIASEGLAGLGDAIMQGVARAGSGNFLNNIQRNKEANINNARETSKSLDESNLKHLAEKRGLEGMSSKTPLGASETPMLSAVLQKMGYPPDKIEGMLKNPMAAKAALGPMADIFSATMKAQLEAELKKMELGMQAQNLSLTHEEKSRQLALDKLKEEKDAADKLSNPLTHPFSAWAARKKQEEAAGLMPSHGVPDLGSTFNGQKVMSVKRIK